MIQVTKRLPPKIDTLALSQELETALGKKHGEDFAVTVLFREDAPPFSAVDSVTVHIEDQTLVDDVQRVIAQHAPNKSDQEKSAARAARQREAMELLTSEKVLQRLREIHANGGSV